MSLEAHEALNSDIAVRDCHRTSSSCGTIVQCLTRRPAVSGLYKMCQVTVRDELGLTEPLLSSETTLNVMPVWFQELIKYT
jgi:hypothetical protein